MENLESFKNAQSHFKIWAPERQKVLKDLTTIRDEIQRQAKIHRIGSITYSGVGLIGGGLAIAGIVTAPFTFGTSLALTVAGVATGVTSGVAGLTHGVVKIGIVRKQCNAAKESLDNHEKACKKIKELVILLKKDIEIIEADIRDSHTFETVQVKEGVKQSGSAASIDKHIANSESAGKETKIEKIVKGMSDSHTYKTSQVKEGMKQSASAATLGKGIANLVQSSQAVAVYRITGNVDEVAKVMRLGAALDDIVPSAVKDISKGVTKLSTEALSVFAAIGIIVDLGSLIWNAVDLAKIERGKLCDEAEKLQKVIKQMEEEYKVLDECFNQLE